MPEIKITCPSCGQPFQADANKKQVFCVNCGTLVDRTQEVLAQEGEQPVDPGDLRYEAAVEAFNAVRFHIVDKKTGQKGDRLVELWTLLIYHGRNSRSRWAVRAATKEIGQFFERKIWQEALAKAGQDRSRLLSDQLLDSAVVYLTACRDDSRYGSKLLGMVKMSQDSIVEKTISDVCSNIIGFLLRIGKPGETAGIIYAIVMAFPRVFPAHRQALSDRMPEFLTPEEQTAALSMVAAVAENMRRS